MSQDRSRFRQQVIGIGFAGDDGGKCREKQHARKNTGAVVQKK
jgi:hypothetical protein